MNRGMDRVMQRGIVPVILGTAVTITGLGLINNRNRQGRRRRNRPFAWGMTGFGLAHILLGSIYRMMNNTGKTGNEAQNEQQGLENLVDMATIGDEINLNGAKNDTF